MTDVGGPRRPDTRPTRLAESGLDLYRPALLAAASALCGSAAECEDLVRETFLRALGHMYRGNEPAGNQRAWLVAILRSVLIDRVRGEHATSDVDDHPASEPAPQPPWTNVTVTDVRAALAAIDADLRAVFELHHLEGLRYREIAIQLGIPENVVPSRLLRARKALREQLLAASSGGEGR